MPTNERNLVKEDNESWIPKLSQDDIGFKDGFDDVPESFGCIWSVVSGASLRKAHENRGSSAFSCAHDWWFATSGTIHQFQKKHGMMAVTHNLYWLVGIDPSTVPHTKHLALVLVHHGPGSRIANVQSRFFSKFLHQLQRVWPKYSDEVLVRGNGTFFLHLCSDYFFLHSTSRNNGLRNT